MAKDVYQRENDEFGGTFAADGATVTFTEFFDAAGGSRGAGAGLLTQNLNTTYNQMVTKIYEVGTQFIYFVGGRTQGNTGLSRILGPRKIQIGFYQKFGNVCNAGGNLINLSIANQCPGANPQFNPNIGTDQGKSNYLQKFCVIMSLGMAVVAQDSIINEQVQFMFGSMTVTTTG